VSAPHVLFVDHTGVLGGAELYLLDVARHTPNAHVVLFETGPFRDKLLRAGVPVTVLPAPPAVLNVRRNADWMTLFQAPPALLSLTFQLARLARAADLVYLNSQKALVVGALAAFLARRPAVWNLHDILTADHFSALNRRLAVFCANCFVDRVIVNSEATRTAFVESGGRTPTGLAYNGIDPTPFNAVTQAQVEELRRELGLGTAPVVGVFSRLAAWKGQHVLLDALAQMPSVHALLVGDALFGEDDEYVRLLRTKRKALGLTDRVHFLGFREDVPVLMHLVDILAHTSTAPEPFGRVIVEGMLAGTPVVATDAGGAREIIADGDNGLLVPPNNPSALQNALSRLLSAPGSAQCLAQTGQKVARIRYSPDAMLSSIATYVKEVVGHGSISSNRGLHFDPSEKKRSRA
jgi:glycosyltransferase involved in cell wall biosynthesis